MSRNESYPPDEEIMTSDRLTIFADWALANGYEHTGEALLKLLAMEAKR